MKTLDKYSEPLLLISRSQYFFYILICETDNITIECLFLFQSGAIVEMDGSGQVLQTWQDMGDSTPSSERIRFISEVQPIKYSRTQDNGSSDDPQDVYDVHELWYGSWRNGFIGIIPSASTHQATV